MNAVPAENGKLMARVYFYTVFGMVLIAAFVLGLTAYGALAGFILAVYFGKQVSKYTTTMERLAHAGNN